MCIRDRLVEVRRELVEVGKENHQTSWQYDVAVSGSQWQFVAVWQSVAVCGSFNFYKSIISGSLWQF